MNKFYIKIISVIFLVLLLNWVVLSYFLYFSSIELSNSWIIALQWGLFFISFFIIVLLIRSFYEWPVRDLEITLKRFLVWDLSEDEIYTESINPSIRFILKFFKRTIASLKNIKDEFIHGKEIKSEVELAKEIQDKILSKIMIEVPSLSIISWSKPAWEIWWDSHDIIKQWDNYYIYVWDATWHWVGAWFIMVMVNALVSALSKMYKSGAEILTKTNEELKPRVKANLLMTMLLLRWNEKEKRLFITWAWHEYLMIYKQKEWKVYKIKSGWIALGMIKDVSKLLKEREIKFEKWDIVILYSDWITEAINQQKRDGKEQLFWEQRLEEAISNAPNIKWENYKSATSVFNNITIYLSQFMGYKFKQLDDITLTVIQYKPDSYEYSKDYSKNISKDFITEWNW